MSDPLDLSGAKDNSPEKSRVTKLQEKLYSPNTQFQIRARQTLKRPLKDVPDSWGGSDKDSFSQQVNNSKMSVFTKIFLTAFVFFVASLGFAFYKFFGNNNETYSSTVEVSVIGPVSIGGGEVLSFDVIIQNKNPFPLQTVDMVIEYPEGTKTKDLQNDMPRFREGLGDIQPNSVVKKTYTAVLFGEENQQKDIEARIEYRVPNSNAIFESKKNFAIALQSAPVRLVIDTVKEITSGQALNFDIRVESNSNTELENVLVTAEYPFGFNFSEATLNPTTGNNVWFFERLAPQESKQFNVRGSLIGQNNEERVFRWNVGLGKPENKNEFAVKFTTIPNSVTLMRPFLALDLAIDGDFAVDLIRDGSTVVIGRLTYTNNTGSVITEPRIILKLNGEVLDDPSVEVDGGFFNSSDNTITWDRVTKPDTFSQIDIGQTETLAFSFKSRELATRQAVYKNPEIVISAEIVGKRVGEDNVPENIDVDIAKRVKFKSDVRLSALTSRKVGPFEQSGPIPPKVENDTTYELTLDLTNSSNLLERGKVTAVLPPYVRWNNLIYPENEKVTFSPSSRTVTWDLGDVREHIGFIDPARSVKFLVTLNPSANQVGQMPALLSDLKFQGYDSFVKTDTVVSSQPPTTLIGTGLDDTEQAQVVE